ncbi:MAG: ATP-binding protein [Sulfurimonas sp.]|nr:ATP-binding protein [Sulfurimonas sp.]
MIGRTEELTQLNNLCELSESSLMVIHGRRRIGKTYLVDFMFEEHRKDCMFFGFSGAYEVNSKTQIKNFIEAVYDWFKIEPSKEIADWTDAFNFLKRTIDAEVTHKEHMGKVSLFFDEVPWIDKSNKDGFLSALGHFWNTYCQKQKRFVLILCGSNASWIKNKILKDSNGPLHNRVTHQIAMKPFDLQETKKYLIEEKGFDLDSKKILETYMVFGGVAKYLSYLDPLKTIEENIDALYFNINGLMYGEYDEVFKSLFEDKAGVHKAVIDYMSTKNSGYTIKEVSSGTGIKVGTKLTSIIDELVMCGFISGIGKYGNVKKDTKYIINDPHSIFHNKWVKQFSKNEIANLKKHYWSDISLSQKYAIWAGFMFETIAIINLPHYLKARGIQGVVKGASYWSYIDTTNSAKGAQIDIVVEYGNGIYDIVECKYYNDEYVITAEYAKKLKNKLKQFLCSWIKWKNKKRVKTCNAKSLWM